MEIVATVRVTDGGESFLKKVERLYNIGVRKLRFNYAKVPSKENKERLFNSIKATQEKWNDMKIIIDIPFPGKKARVFFKQGGSLSIQKGNSYRFFLAPPPLEEENNDLKIFVSNINNQSIKIGMRVIYDSGEGAFVITNKCDNHWLDMIALNNFTLFDSKSLSFQSFIKESYKNIIEEIFSYIKADEIAFSFVEKASDLSDALWAKEKYGFNIISKIETVEGIRNLGELLKLTDAVLLGRGDLGVNSVMKNLFNYEKEVADKCRSQGVFCYFATGFMNSCAQNYLPSNSDIIDLNYAISLHPSSIIFNAGLVLSEGFEHAVQYVREIEESYSLHK